ncbi:hypothetical protein [Rhizobium sp. RHZ01]|uniref:hypothetical protein n=1 Tax=Rhizobium sp. RHZ01 TaxID=2769304 RepID=UPI00177B649D|nr:hypothetical protein [Rhizobium sp. RHZ01]MBD9444884.1 hypothetical protein [Rhizobium sp. RHZ01]
MTERPDLEMEFSVAADDARGGVVAVIRMIYQMCEYNERGTADALMIALIAATALWNRHAPDHTDMKSFCAFMDQAFVLSRDWFPAARENLQ